MLGCLISFDVECTTVIATPADVCIAQVRARRIARQAGLGSKRQLEFAIAASEAASSILDHAGTGSIVLRAVVASHALLDTLTDGGLGVALLWPFTDARYFAPWRPIPVAPIGSGMFSERGLYVIAVETLLFAPILAYGLWPRRRAE